MDSKIKDISLAPQGHLKIQWAGQHMPVLNVLRQNFIKEKPLEKFKVLMCLHLEAKTAYLAETLKQAGAQVTVVASNPLSTQDDVVAALVEKGIKAFAWYGASDEEYLQLLNAGLDVHPQLLVDDGGDLVTTLHSQREIQLKEIIGGSEETTTGIVRLKALEHEGRLKFPMIAVNDALCKYLFDNRYGTGQSVWDGINRTTNLVVAGKNVVVVGYGWCGKGVALRAKGLGARVIVCEIDPIKANEAWMDGFEVMPMLEASKAGDFFVTVTGNLNVIRKEHFEVMKDGAVLANAGHFDVEISKPDLRQLAVNIQKVRQNVEEYQLADGRRLHLLAEGRLVNLAAGDGHPAEIMDMSFSLQALSIIFLAKNQRDIPCRVLAVPEEIDSQVATLRLQSMGLKIDKLTEEQRRYLASWQS